MGQKQIKIGKGPSFPAKPHASVCSTAPGNLRNVNEKAQMERALSKNTIMHRCFGGGCKLQRGRQSIEEGRKD